MYSGLIPNGSRVSVTLRCTRSWMAIANMPRSPAAYPVPSRSHRCSGGSQSLPVAKLVPGMARRSSRSL